jgi:hypothetical protein
MPGIIQRSFTGGEIAPALYSRCDTTKYTTGLRTMRNNFIMKHGGAANRAGTKFIGEIYDSAQNVRLIDFIRSATETFVIELTGSSSYLGSGTMRFIKNGNYVYDLSGPITSISGTTNTTIHSVAHGLVDGHQVRLFTNIPGLYKSFLVQNATADTFEIRHLIPGSFTGSPVAYDSSTWVSGGIWSKYYTVSHPYYSGHLADLHYIQSADVMTFTHPGYRPYELKHLSLDTNWTMSLITFEPKTPAPTGLAHTTRTTGDVCAYVVTAVSKETYEESYPSSVLTCNVAPAIGASSVTIKWVDPSVADPATPVKEWNVYRSENGGVYGFIGTALPNTIGGAGFIGFTDEGRSKDTSITPPIQRDPFNLLTGYGNPATCTYTQQRLGFANMVTKSESVQLSRTGQFHNFSTSSPIQEDDAVQFTMAGRQVNEVRHLLDMGSLLIFTESGEWGLQPGPITPSSIALKQFSYNGASKRRPIVINNTALYVQARGSIVRDMAYNIQMDGYTGNDLTVFSTHLFDGFQIVDWAYQKVPHSIVWAVRDDGNVIGLTYVKEHEIVGWHRHDFEGGFVEKVCAVPEGDEDAVYFVVRREVNGVTRRYVERMSSRRVSNMDEAAFMDSWGSWDGRCLGQEVTLTGSAWTYTDTVTMTFEASGWSFTDADIGNEIHITSGSDVIRVKITGFTSTYVIEGQPNKTIPVSMRGVALTDWKKAIKTVIGLHHLEGKEVSVLGDSTVVGSPHNPAYSGFTVEDGCVTLDKCYGVIMVGLPITSDLETLDIDMPQGETLAPKKKNITKVSVIVQDSVGLWAGQKPVDDSVDPLDQLVETKVTDLVDYETANKLYTGTLDVSIMGNWNSNGRVFIRHIDPLPLSVLAVIPTGLVPFQGGK